MDNRPELPLPSPGGDRTSGGLPCDPLHDVSVRRAARLLGLDCSTVYRRIDRGQIPAYRCHREWLIPRAYLQAALAQPSGGTSAPVGQEALPDLSGPPADAPGAPGAADGTGPAAVATPTWRPAPDRVFEHAEALLEAREELLRVLETWLASLGSTYEPLLLGVLEETLPRYAARQRAYRAALTPEDAAGDGLAQRPTSDPRPGGRR